MTRFIAMLKVAFRPWIWFSSKDVEDRVAPPAKEKGIPLREIYHMNVIHKDRMISDYGFTKDEVEKFHRMFVSRRHALVRKGDYFTIVRLERKQKGRA